MRELSFKGYLQQQLCELSGYDGKSLYKLARLAENNSRLNDVLSLYLCFLTNENLKERLYLKYTFLAKKRAESERFAPDNIEQAKSEYKTIYENYLYKKNKKTKEDKLKVIMRDRILELQKEKGISNYRVYTALGFNHGNVNAFLKNGDTSKAGLATVRRILEYVTNYG